MHVSIVLIFVTEIVQGIQVDTASNFVPAACTSSSNFYVTLDLSS